MHARVKKREREIENEEIGEERIILYNLYVLCASRKCSIILAFFNSKMPSENK